MQDGATSKITRKEQASKRASIAKANDGEKSVLSFTFDFCHCMGHVLDRLSLFDTYIRGPGLRAHR